MWSVYFVVKTVTPVPFSAKSWPHGRKAERKTMPNFNPTERHKMTERHRKSTEYC